MAKEIAVPLASPPMRNEFRRRRLAGMDVPGGIAEPQFPVLARVGVEEGEIFVDGARNHVEIELFRLARLPVHEEGQAFGAGVAQPFVDRQAVAFRLGNLLALLVEEEFVIEAFRRRSVERAGDLARQLYRIDQVLAGHFVIDAERAPAHRPVRLPLQLAMAASDRRLEFFARLGVGPGDHATRGINFVQRHLHDDAGVRVDRQERRVGRGAFGAQRGQHDFLDGVITRQHFQQVASKRPDW